MRVSAVVKRIYIQMLRDKRALALMMVAPLIILTLLHYLLGASTPQSKIGVNSLEDSLIDQLEAKDLIVIPYDGEVQPKGIVAEENLDGFLTRDNQGIQLLLTNDQPSTAKALQMKVQQAIAAENANKQATNLSLFVEPVQSQIKGSSSKLKEVKFPSIQTTYLYGNKHTSFFDQLSPILTGFFVFFFVFLISGIALLRERNTGTLDRMMATPIKRREIVFGYLLGYGMFAILQTLIVVVYAVKVLNIMLAGSIWNVILINFSLALVALSLGILLSAFANSEFQMMQFIPIAIIPQVFFSGILPVEGMADWVQLIAKAMPMYYGGSALIDVMYKGLGFGEILNELLVLLAFALVFILLNIIALKKYRKI